MRTVPSGSTVEACHARAWVSPGESGSRRPVRGSAIAAVFVGPAGPSPPRISTRPSGSGVAVRPTRPAGDPLLVWGSEGEGTRERSAARTRTKPTRTEAFSHLLNV